VVIASRLSRPRTDAEVRAARVELERLRDRHAELCVAVPAERRTDGLFHVCTTYIAAIGDLVRDDEGGR
jgi:hypothetical protein